MGERGRCKRCHNYAINPHQHGRTPGVNEHLCDVCYWRDQYEGADLRHGVAVARIAELEGLLDWEFGECVYCGQRNIPINNRDHWLECPSHPAHARIAELEAQLAEAREDSSRLDWLENPMNRVCVEVTSYGKVTLQTRHDGGTCVLSESLRAAIDAAREPQP